MQIRTPKTLNQSSNSAFWSHPEFWAWVVFCEGEFYSSVTHHMSGFFDQFLASHLWNSLYSLLLSQRKKSTPKFYHTLAYFYPKKTPTKPLILTVPMLLNLFPFSEFFIPQIIVFNSTSNSPLVLLYPLKKKQREYKQFASDVFFLRCNRGRAGKEQHMKQSGCHHGQSCLSTVGNYCCKTCWMVISTLSLH